MKIKNTKLISRTFILIFCFVLSQISSAVVTVGLLGDGCDYDNLLDAYIDNDPVVHVTNQINHFDAFTITKTKYFNGGYDDCTDAENNVVSDTKSVWRKSQNGTVVNINADHSEQSIVSISNFEIFGGEDISFAGVGGISVQGNSSVILNNIDIHNNRGDLGGGILIFGSDAQLEMNHSSIRNNIAETAGGGIYCESNSEVLIQNDSVIKNNNSLDDGGGIFAISNCQITISTGDTLDPEFTSLGIIDNTAIKFGGGIYAASDSNINLNGTINHPASVSNNQTLSSSLSASGGGIYASGLGTIVRGTNARIDDNFSPKYGAGVAIDDHAVFIMDRTNEPCWDNDKCSSISNNYTNDNNSGAAAGGFNNAAFVEINRTVISGNRSNYASVFTIGSASTVSMEGNLIVNNTSNSQPFSAELFSLFGQVNNGGTLNFLYNTVSDNNTDNTFKLFGQDSDQNLKVLHSIINGTGDILTTTGNMNHNILWGCLIVHENQSLLGSVFQSLILNPSFLDIQNGDYHLSSNSPAIDFCDDSITPASNNDLNNQPRGIDDKNSQNFLGTYDLGAYEFQNNDLIFQSGFE